jgi:hypothetical protein
MVGPNETQSPFLAETEQDFFSQRFGNAVDSTPRRRKRPNSGVSMNETILALSTSTTSSKIGTHLASTDFCFSYTWTLAKVTVTLQRNPPAGFAKPAGAAWPQAIAVGVKVSPENAIGTRRLPKVDTEPTTSPDSRRYLGRHFQGPFGDVP